MKPISNLMVMAMLAFLSACNAPSGQSDTAVRQPLPDSFNTGNIFISFKGYDSFNIGFAWFYFNAYNQQIQIVPRQDTISVNWSKDNLLLYYTLPQTGYYPVSPGDSITITRNAVYPYYPKVEIQKNRFTAFELNFPSFLSEKNSSVFEYSTRKIPNKSFPLNGNAKQYYDRSIFLTDSCVKAGIIGKEYEAWLRKALKNSFYTQAIWEKELQYPVISNALKTEPPDMHDALYRIFLQDYFYNIDLKGRHDFKRGYGVAKQKYSGEPRDFLLLTSLLKIIKGKEADKEKYISMFNEDCRNENYKNYIAQYYTSLSSVNISKNDMVIDSKRKKFSLDSVLAGSNDSLTYIDVWASWCAPCRSEMPNSERLRQHYANKNIRFIFLSIDDNYNDWIRAAHEEKLNENSYFLINAKESMFNKKFKIHAIPRYILINKSGKVINSDAPRPGNIEVQKLIDENL
ncbi:TlpA family protein disulfide reductase [Parafilimonas sp.]|uniref:TlpA family protein disulfide reductase n=1 Tax=Parafilimonas sp. TaxID=1969739 RepID=UPI0039E3E5EB